MKTIAIGTLWLLSGAGFIYYPRILLSATGKLKSLGTNAVSLRKRMSVVMSPSVLLAVFFPLTYMLTFKMSRQAFEDHLNIESWLWMFPTLLFSGVIVLLFRNKARKN